MDAVDCWRIGDIARLAQQLNDALAASEMLLAKEKEQSGLDIFRSQGRRDSGERAGRIDPRA